LQRGLPFQVQEKVKLAKRIYVGNLPFSANEDSIREMFEPYGEVVSIAMINDRETGRFRGFCFVEMADADADAAIQALNDKDVGGRTLRVNEAQPREDRRGGGNGGMRRSDGGDRPRRDDRSGDRGGDRDRDRGGDRDRDRRRF
jgi:cold-inducible RNA-binding protein